MPQMNPGHTLLPFSFKIYFITLFYIPLDYQGGHILAKALYQWYFVLIIEFNNLLYSSMLKNATCFSLYDHHQICIRTLFKEQVKCFKSCTFIPENGRIERNM
jgi:hypothetical protein